MTPLTVEYLALSGTLAGGLGGLVAAINAVFGGFKALPVKPMSVSKAAVKSRAMFVTYRTLVGGIFGGAISFWFGPDVVVGSLSIDKLAFLQFSAGLAGSMFSQGGMSRTNESA